MASPTTISVKQLSRLIGTQSAPVVLDVRTQEDFDDDPRILPAATHRPFPQVQGEAETLASEVAISNADGRAVIYCQKGLKISEGVAALLRTQGIAAEVLEGGHFGWRDAKHLFVDSNSIPKRNASGQSVWVTRVRPKVDRIACGWLIRRFVDPHAQFLFVTGSEVMAVAEKFNATPFDVDTASLSHSGDNCTFDAMLEEFGLLKSDAPSEALRHVASVVRGADTDKLDLTPQCSGLLAISLGLSRIYKDDLAQLEAGMAVYDALYRWARDATDERHTHSELT